MSNDEQQSEGQVSSAESLADTGEIYPDQATAGYPVHPEDDEEIEDGATGVESSKPQEGTAGPNASPYSGKPTNEN